jgi:C_GCAxxG_C_C family probable redox protein
MGNGNDDLIRAMGAFGGGLGGNGEVCGALVGALACLGLKYGLTVDEAGDSRAAYSYAEEILKRFRDEICKGSILCRDITGVDWKNAKQVEEYRKSNNNTCWILVGRTAQLIGEMLERDSEVKKPA